MSNVVPILGGEINQETGISLNVVDLLRRRLEQAERGEIIAVAIITVDPAEKVNAKSAGNSRHCLMAGTVYLQLELARD